MFWVGLKVCVQSRFPVTRVGLCGGNRYVGREKVFSSTTAAGTLGCLVRERQGWKFRFSTQFLLMGLEVGLRFFSVVFG